MRFQFLTLLTSLFAGVTLAAVPAVPADGNYIVVLKANSPLSLVDTIVKAVLGIALSPLQQFTVGNLTGFATTLNSAQVVALQHNPSVAYVEADGTIHTLGRLSPSPKGALQRRALLTESPGIWGLGRVSHKVKGISTYVYDSTAAQNTCVYVIDSGINTAHVDFGGRATSVANWVTTEPIDDLLGHGTAVAGTVGSNTYGVAKKTAIYSLKVCDQNGNCAVSSVVAAISYAVNDSKNRACANGVSINLSLGGVSSGWQSVKDAVVAATNAGLFVVAAAGNDGANTANYLPASAPGACAVGATDSTDTIASWSNWGATLAVFAPGVYVESTYIGSTSATAYFDGTSMSAPHVAGLGLYFNAKIGKQSPVGLCNLIKTNATLNAISGLSGLTGTPNKLAYNGAA